MGRNNGEKTRKNGALQKLIKGENEVGVDLALIPRFMLYYANHVVLSY